MIISSEKEYSINGVAGRLYPRHAWDHAPETLFSAQKWISERRPYVAPGYRKGATIRAEIRFDDNCRNGHNTFAITGEIREPGMRDVSACGCIHDDIAAAFPELAHLIRWHLCSADGPMHYEANTVYLAGDRDHNGRRAGEPAAVADVIHFGAVPMIYRLPCSLVPFLREIADYDPNGQAAALIPIAVAHEDRPGQSYRFAPKYQFAGQKPLKWHECPFDTEEEAERFAESFVNHSPRLISMGTSWSEGKPRELDKARASAIWPDATDEQLSADPAELRAALAARLPDLLQAFRADIEAAGLLWAPAEAE